MEIANIYNHFQTAVAGTERAFDILDEQPEPSDCEGAVHLQRPVLKDLSIRIPAGTKAAVVGATGSGKTTLIQLLTRFYDVSQGSVLLDGRDLREYRMEDLRRAFGGGAAGYGAVSGFGAGKYLLRQFLGCSGTGAFGRTDGRCRQLY
ncbi:MAG: ABC transporter ATP-binding protein [Lachnospiraceae bacterium]|nr:ABC transporter ATP-binding protein [Lachnospiraceae bacterium]